MEFILCAWRSASMSVVLTGTHPFSWTGHSFFLAFCRWQFDTGEKHVVDLGLSLAVCRSSESKVPLAGLESTNLTLRSKLTN